MSDAALVAPPADLPGAGTAVAAAHGADPAHPLAVAAAGTAASAPPPAEAEPAAPPPTVLLVDDEPSVLSALRRLLRLNGFAIEQATSGADGLRILREQAVDVVISDMRMPEMDGASFLEHVRQERPDTVRLLLTGYSDIGATVAAINRGEIYRYIAKPWDDQDLLLIIREGLDKRALQQRNAELLALTTAQNLELHTLNHALETRVAERTTELQLAHDQLSHALEELTHTFTTAVSVFTGLLEMRGSGIAGHGRRVGELGRRIAEKLGLSDAECHDVHLAGLLHDVGQIAFDDAMLSKPASQFSVEEQSRYARHPQDGETALMALHQLQAVATIVRQHHERMDGRGFPDGLQGHAIVLGARIVAVASAYDDMVSGQAAERQYTPEMARKMLIEGAGMRYDARVVMTTMAVLDDLNAQADAEVTLDAHELRPRMVLARDLLSNRGVILLPQGLRLDATVVAKLRALADRSGRKLVAHVLRSSLDGGRPGASRVANARV